MRASRLLSILMLLQARGRLSATALAREVGVSVRTVYRDMDALGASGVPVTVERGAAGGFELVEGWRTRLTGLTVAEAQAVFLSGLPGPAGQLGLSEAMASAQLKLLAALPAGWQADARRIGSRFHLDPVGWYQKGSPASHLPAVAQAVWREERIRVRYQSWRGTVDRRLEPLGLVLKAGEWYLVARSGADIRTYRLSSILRLDEEHLRFTRPKSFDLERCWNASLARFEAELYRGQARLRVTERGLRRLRDLNAATAAAVDAADSRSDARGRWQVTIPIESVDHAARAPLALGAEAEVLEPRELREKLAITARAMAQLYASK